SRGSHQNLPSGPRQRSRIRMVPSGAERGRVKEAVTRSLSSLSATSVQQSNESAYRRSRIAVTIVALGLALIGVFVLSIALGSIRIPIHDVLSAFTGETVNRSTSVIIRDVRLPRSLTALLAGAALGIAGLQMQTLFRNPLADPFVLGIASGASLGVAL